MKEFSFAFREAENQQLMRRETKHLAGRRSFKKPRFLMRANIPKSRSHLLPFISTGEMIMSGAIPFDVKFVPVGTGPAVWDDPYG